MKDWPLHLTVADVFSLYKENTKIVSKFEELLSGVKPIKLTSEKESLLGTAPVILFKHSHDIYRLHIKLVDLLVDNGAVFNSPEFTRAGFIAHSTIQHKNRLELDKEYLLDSLSLVDMFPDEDWEKRRVINTFPF